MDTKGYKYRLLNGAGTIFKVALVTVNFKLNKGQLQKQKYFK